MPHISERQLLLQDLEACLELQLFYEILAAQGRIEMAMLRGVSPLILSAAPFARDAGLFASYLALNGVTVKDEIPLIPFPDLLQLYETVISRRYLDIRLPVPRAPSRVQWLLDECEESRFKQEVRMQREHFFRLVDLVRSHPTFTSSGLKPQNPPEQ